MLNRPSPQTPHFLIIPGAAGAAGAAGSPGRRTGRGLPEQVPRARPARRFPPGLRPSCVTCSCHCLRPRNADGAATTLPDPSRPARLSRGRSRWATGPGKHRAKRSAGKGSGQSPSLPAGAGDSWPFRSPRPTRDPGQGRQQLPSPGPAEEERGPRRCGQGRRSWRTPGGPRGQYPESWGRQRGSDTGGRVKTEQRRPETCREDWGEEARAQGCRPARSRQRREGASAQPGGAQPWQHLGSRLGAPRP